MRAFLRTLVQHDDPETATPVPSSDLWMVAVEGSDLLISFHSDYAARHGYWGVAYHADDEATALQMRENILNNPDGYFWTSIRGNRFGPAYFTGKMTPGGTSASVVPYDYTDFEGDHGLDDFEIHSRPTPRGVNVRGYPWYSRLRDIVLNSPEELTQMINMYQGIISREFISFRPRGRRIIIDRINTAIRNV